MVAITEQTSSVEVPDVAILGGVLVALTEATTPWVPFFIHV